MSNVIADVGQNPVFVAFMAHAGFGYAVVLTTWAGTGSLHPTLVAAAAMTLAAAIKEFWFDARFEMHPPQTFKDNFTDFIGYAAGVAIALGVTLALAR
jgi:hypothetical protein